VATIPTTPFGRTGHESTRVIFGAAALWSATQEVADRVLELLLEYGVNHIDTAASYGDSELRIGPWMAEHRDRFFLATKTEERTCAAARDGIRRSLERLRVDRVDLIQLHNLVEPGEWETALGAGGALEACLDARDEGLVRFIGVTGHGVTVAAQHGRALERFDFDAVLLPYSYVLVQNGQYAADFEALVSVCRERDVAVQTIKALVRSPWPEGTAANRTTWYRPLEDERAVELAVHWVLGRPDVFLNSVGDVDLLPEVLAAAARFEARPGEEAMRHLVEAQDMAPLFT
jgi:aryl-alcohol dehydrogenase-like predicted oxidoreductase